jgi:hypothetical protein
MFSRDPVSKAVINTEDSYYKSILARRNDAAKNQQLQCELNELKDELSNIRMMLQQITCGNKDG